MPGGAGLQPQLKPLLLMRVFVLAGKPSEVGQIKRNFLKGCPVRCWTRLIGSTHPRRTMKLPFLGSVNRVQYVCRGSLERNLIGVLDWPI